MIALILFLLLGPPPMVYGSDVTLNERAACKVWWSSTEHRCRDEDVENLGSWDVRPSPEEWDRNAYQSAPPDFGAYATEKRD